MLRQLNHSTSLRGVHNLKLPQRARQRELLLSIVETCLDRGPAQPRELWWLRLRLRRLLLRLSLGLELLRHFG
jgi:hypothetical protein